MNAQPLIVMDGVCFSYGGEDIVHEASFSVAAGEFLAIIGPNGGGKTTLLKLLLGLLRPQRGKIIIAGEAPPVRKLRVGYVPQFSKHSTDFPLTVQDAVLLGRMGLRPGRTRWQPDDLQMVQAVLERVDMAGFAQKRMGELSGGQRQRVLVARALACAPQLLLLDEPSSNIDAVGQKSLFQLLRDLNSQMTIAVVSHDLMVLSSHVRSVACVNRTVHYHQGNHITEEMVGRMYPCPVDLVAHGVPHRVLATHDHRGQHNDCCKGHSHD